VKVMAAFNSASSGGISASEWAKPAKNEYEWEQRFEMRASETDEPTPTELSNQYGVSHSEWHRTKRTIRNHQRMLARDGLLLVLAHVLVVVGAAVPIVLVVPDPIIAYAVLAAVVLLGALTCALLLRRFRNVVVPRRRAAVCGLLTRVMFGYKGLAVVYRSFASGTESGFFLIPWAVDQPELAPAVPLKRRTTLNSLGSLLSSESFKGQQLGRLSSRETRGRKSPGRQGPSAGNNSGRGALGVGVYRSNSRNSGGSLNSPASPSRARGQLSPKQTPHVPPLPLQLHDLADGDVLSTLPLETAVVQDAISQLAKLVQTADGGPTVSGEERLHAIQIISRLLARETSPPIKQALAAGALAPLVKAMSELQPSRPQSHRSSALSPMRTEQHLAEQERYLAQDLAFEATWAITNIAAGHTEHARATVTAGCVPHLIRFGRTRGARSSRGIETPDDKLAQQAIWALGNLAGDSPFCRDAVMQAGCAAVLCDHLAAADRLPQQRTAAWAACNASRTEPHSDVETLRPLVVGLAQLVSSGLADEEALSQALWALAYVSQDDGRPSAAVAQALGERGIRRLVELMQHKAIAVSRPALRTVGKLAGGDDVQTNLLVQEGAVPRLISLLSVNLTDEWRSQKVRRSRPRRVSRGGSHAATQTCTQSLAARRISRGGSHALKPRLAVSQSVRA
jgi:hypothetical protein